MKIKSIELENHPILGNSAIDFTDSNGNIINNVIIVGENGTGKSTLLNLIYEFTTFQIVPLLENEKRKFVIHLNHDEIEKLKKSKRYSNHFKTINDNGEIIIEYDAQNGENWNSISVKIENGQGGAIVHTGGSFGHNEFRSAIKSLYSDVEINFDTQNINSVTARDLDTDITNSVKTTKNISQEITQLIVDIVTQDSIDFTQWAESTESTIIDRSKLNQRMKRFTSAFEFMLDDLRFHGIENENGIKKVYFIKNGCKIPIEKLSSGEKQIVFRGSFLLKDKRSTQGALILLDEPEISLHPTWQLKINDYYKKLFTNELGQQTSQLFFVTHSPFIVHNIDRTDDKVFTFTLSSEGNLNIDDEGVFYGWDSERTISKAFNYEGFYKNANESKSNLIVTEGKTDWKHLKNAYASLSSNKQIAELDIEFMEYESEVNMGSKQLLKLCESISLLPNTTKIICVFDCDEKDIIKKVTQPGEQFKSWGNNVYSCVLPVPNHRHPHADISIEHLYFDSDLLKVDQHGRRLFLASEFSRRTGLNKAKTLICEDKHKCNPSSIKIIDSGVLDVEDETKNLALSKNDYAQQILDKIAPFENINYDEFINIFDVIKDILND